MKERPFENRVIIIGADHHNTLAAIRAFGQEGCEIAVIVHGHALERKKVQVFSSRYVDQNQAHIIQDNENELMKVLKQYGDEKQKDILFPASDFAEYVIDSNYDMLSPRFVCPGFVGKPGEVCRMMDKWNQYLFAKEHGISVAPTFLIDIRSPEIPMTLKYPCIVKPRISALGSKTDIKICSNKNELISALKYFEQNKYCDALVQQFVHKKYEVLSMGGVINSYRNKMAYGGAFVKLREQLESATSFALFVIDNTGIDHTDETSCLEPEEELADLGISTGEWKQLNHLNKAVVTSLIDEGYQGQYDIEFLICDNIVYLNEINYRQSGAGYAVINQYVNSPFYWACGMLANRECCRLQKSVDVGSYFMAELYDMIYIKRREITIFQWIRDVRRASSFAVYDPHDMRATGRYYRDRIRGVIRKATKHALRLR